MSNLQTPFRYDFVGSFWRLILMAIGWMEWKLPS